MRCTQHRALFSLLLTFPLLALVGCSAMATQVSPTRAPPGSQGAPTPARERIEGVAPASDAVRRAEFETGDEASGLGDQRLADSSVPLGNGMNAPIFRNSTLATRQAMVVAAARDRRIVIYIAQLGLTVVDIETAISAATDVAQELGGHVQRRSETSVTLRIPAARFDEAVGRFEGLGAVTSRQVEGTDVTEEYVDLEARIRAAEAVRERLLALLAKADKVEAALAVEKELGRVNAELESLKARFEVIKNRVALSTITLNFTTVARLRDDLKPLVRLPFGWLDELDACRLLGQSDAWRSRRMR